MAGKAADLAKFQVNIEKPDQPPPASEKKVRPPDAKLITKGFRISPEAARQFDLLKAEMETGTNGKNKGPALIAEALNMLFEKYGKPPIA
jgi:hypothetical protein